MTDPFPQFTAFLENFLLYSIFVGIILSTISGVIAGIAYLPIFTWLLNEQRDAWGRHALRGTVIGLSLILLALPMRNALLANVHLPAGLPPIPLSTPVTPTAKPVQ